jgi:cyclase
MEFSSLGDSLPRAAFRHSARLRARAFTLPLVLIATACSSTTPRLVVTAPNEIAEISPGVWFRHGELEHSGHCNNGIILFADWVLVVDANFPSGAEDCIADVQKITKHPVKIVFDTHHHGDHAYGNPVWAAHGALPLAHAKVLEEIARYEPKRWLDEKRDDVKALGRDAPMPPTLTYVEKMVADDGTRRVEFLHFGTAHTHGDGFAYLPKEKILFTGDAVVNGPYNYMGDGDTRSWLDVLDALAKLDVDVVAPGHGPLSDGSLIELQRQYIAHLRDAVAAGIAAGKSPEDIAASFEAPEEIRRFVGPFLPDQVKKIHGEMTAN